MRKSWTTKEIKELQTLFQKGFSAKEIGVILCRSDQSINRALSRFNLRNEEKQKPVTSISFSLPSFTSHQIPEVPPTFTPLPLKKWQGYSGNSGSFFQSFKFKNRTFKIPIKETGPPPPSLPQKTPLQSHINWAHENTSLRILPIQKGAQELFFYVRDLENLHDKKYLKKDGLISLLNIHRKNSDLPPFIKT